MVFADNNEFYGKSSRSEIDTDEHSWQNIRLSCNSSADLLREVASVTSYCNNPLAKQLAADKVLCASCKNYVNSLQTNPDTMCILI